MRFKSLIWELHRRHVFKSGVAYLVVSWAIVQVLDVVIPAFTWPEEIIPFSIVVLLVCFPIWLGISWFYDLTEDGIVRTKKVQEGEEIVSTKNVNLNKVIITSLSVLVILLIVNTFRMKAENRNSNKTEDIRKPEFKSSIAVLAFADMSPEKDHEFLGDGMSEEIIHKLTYCKDLKVSSRTSSFSYKHKDITHHAIAEDLDVEYFLEGSVKPFSDSVRITAQLIDASDGAHVWSKTFDRRIEDVLLLYDEIADSVAALLNVTLLTRDDRFRAVDPEAYVLYLKAKDALSEYSKIGTLTADSLIRKSLEIDDSYAPYWMVLSQVLYRKTYHYYLMEPEAGYKMGIKAAKNAIELDSRSPMAYSWLSQFEWQNKRADLAEQHLQTALQLSPNDPLILFQAGRLALRTNRLDEAKVYLDKVTLLDPKNDIIATNDPRDIAYYTKSFLNWTLGNLDEASKDLSNAYSLALPDYLRNYEMALLCRDQGKFDEAIYRMENEENKYLRNLLECSINFAIGKKSESLEILELLKTYPKDEYLKEFIDMEAEHYFEIACLYAYMGDKDNAFAYLEKSFEQILLWPDRFFTTPELNNLRGDPRWDAFLMRLGNAFNYEFLPFEKG